MNRAPFSALEHVVRAANIECFNSRQLAAVFVYWHEIDLVPDADMVSDSWFSLH